MAHMCKTEKMNVLEEFFYYRHLNIKESYRYKPVARVQCHSNEEQWDSLRHFWGESVPPFDIIFSINICYI